ncbi:hypothetical protein BJ741DRAFT_598410 [Chytriomyces cf. hyalinus JEL632]|nr:hypothetical protein BJ741DRAFT_598410 [Chytriomyces cf. hyalinus JEL632]
MRFNLAIAIIFAAAATLEAASIPRYARELSFRDTTSNTGTTVGVPDEPAVVDDTEEEGDEVDAVAGVSIQTSQSEATDDEGDDGTTDESPSENENKDDQTEENENTEDTGPEDITEGAENDEGQSEEEAAER